MYLGPIEGEAALRQGSSARRPGDSWAEGASDAVDVRLVAAAEADSLSRSRLLRGAAVVAAGGSGLALVVRGLPKLEALAAPSRAQDRRILNFLLVLEYVQEAFYREALERGNLEGELRRYARLVHENERVHLSFLRRLLGDGARERPSVDFGETTSDSQRFLRAAVALEEAATAGYIGQGPNLRRRFVAEAARVCAVEARHAAWIRDIAGVHPAPRAADPGKSVREVRAALRKANVVVQ
ncbi:MAG: ferritin-like domain-containing protein [Thermoleophilia bacterium]|nr:ferritin-like domain-containing protein [Thermoleophilia bacterium]